jgi:hypothetical protein
MKSRRALSILLSCALVLPVAVAATGPASAACVDTWTGVQTVSKSKVVGVITVKTTAKYTLLTNTCNLGVYTKIKVTQFTNTFTNTGVDEGRGWIDDQGAVLKNCSGLASSGCLVYPGTVSFLDNTDHLHPYAGSTVTGTRTDYPNVTIPYSTTAAIYGRWVTYEGFYFRWVYQFLRGVIYADYE